MLMLENLKKRSALVSNLDSALNTSKYASVIFDGKFLINTKMNKNNIDHILSVFTGSDISLVGANHGIVISPLFALTISENENIAILKQYLILSNENANSLIEQTIQHDLTMLAIAISFFYPQIIQIKLPKIIDEFKNVECELKFSLNDCVLNIKSDKA